MPTQTFAVIGLTCEHCVNAVRTEVGALPGVTAVAVDLQAGGRSTVEITGDALIPDDQFATALDEAGDYRLA